MKWLNFNENLKVFVFLSFFVSVFSLKAQVVRVDTVYIVDTVYLEKKKAQFKYEERAERIKLRWERLVPRYTKIQFAGSMGLLSAGTGWDYGKNKQWETDIFLGVVPKYETDHMKMTMTIKQNFIPWSIHLNENLTLRPFSTGLYINTIFGEEFWRKEPSKYPNGYYSFSTMMRTNVFIGQGWEYRFAPSLNIPCKSVTFFYELSTNELYLIGAVSNKYLKFKDVVGLSLGAKFQFL